MVSTKGDTRAQRLPKETCRFGTDLKFADLQSAKSTKWINDFVASSNNQLVVSTDRYIFQMSALVTLLSKGPQVCPYACVPPQNCVVVFPGASKLCRGLSLYMCAASSLPLSVLVCARVRHLRLTTVCPHACASLQACCCMPSGSCACVLPEACYCEFVPSAIAELSRRFHHPCKAPVWVCKALRVDLLRQRPSCARYPDLVTRRMVWRIWYQSDVHAVVVMDLSGAQVCIHVCVCARCRGFMQT